MCTLTKYDTHTFTYIDYVAPFKRQYDQYNVPYTKQFYIPLPITRYSEVTQPPPNPPAFPEVQDLICARLRKYQCQHVYPRIQ